MYYLKRRHKYFFRKVFFLIMAGGIIAYVIFNRIIKPREFISPVVKNAPTTAPVKQTNSSSLEKVVDDALSGVAGTYGIAIKNFKTDEIYYLNAHKIFEAGSLYKLWVMAETFSQLENRELTEDEVLSGSIQELNDEFGIDPESAELTEGTITLNVKDVLNQMITISHNYAAFLLLKKVDRIKVKTFLQKHDLKESTLEDKPKTTANDTLKFLEKLYKGELAGKGNTQKMLDLLKKQTINDKLPKNLPRGTVIAHKTAEVDYLSHDGGIVFTDKGDYIIVVLSESDSPKGAEERIAQISLAVYKYFAKK